MDLARWRQNARSSIMNDPKRTVEQKQEAARKAETHPLQKDPPEGSREVIERELRRDDEKNGQTGR
jgi:hypothetical protein